jgi:translation elongation factor EF-1alpha
VEEEEIGRVEKFFAKPGVAAVEITAGVLRIGDKVHFKGHTTDFEDTIVSMEVENQAIQEAKAGDVIGMKVKDRVREHDLVYKIL